MDIWEFIRRMDLIARHNHDDFSYRFDIYPQRHQWELTVRETTDQHEFVWAFGSTVEEACVAAWGRVGDALSSWGYGWPDPLVDIARSSS